jgi:tetratricopeptide (TPR) repeat protein
MTEPQSWTLWRSLRLALGIGGALAAASCSSVATRDHAAAGTVATRQTAPIPPGATLRLARASRTNGDFASAISLYRSITALQAADPAILVELGDTLVDAASLDDAIDVYGQAAQRAAARPAVRIDALLGLQQASLNLGQPEQTMRFADQAAALAPADHRVIIGRGVALDLLGRHAEAQAAYRAVLASAPHNVAARNDLALSLALTRQYDEAVGIMLSMARSSNATPRIRQNLALIYGLAGDAPNADALSRTDLDAATIERNLRFFEFVRIGYN